jgi:hypothetical protein
VLNKADLVERDMLDSILRQLSLETGAEAMPFRTESRDLEPAA